MTRYAYRPAPRDQIVHICWVFPSLLFATTQSLRQSNEIVGSNIMLGSSQAFQLTLEPSQFLRCHDITCNIAGQPIYDGREGKSRGELVLSLFPSYFYSPNRDCLLFCDENFLALAIPPFIPFLLLIWVRHSEMADRSRSCVCSSVNSLTTSYPNWSGSLGSGLLERLMSKT